MTRHGADTVAEDYCEKQGCEDIENCDEICDISIMKDRLTEAYREGYRDGEKVGREKAIYSLEYHLPKQIPSIKKRQLAYKDFEENGESWCSLPDSPMLEDGDIIQIIRQGEQG